MSRSSETRLRASAADLRRAFDQSFSQASEAESRRFEDVLGVRIGGDAFVVRLTEISGLLADKKVTAVPSQATALLGIIGLRGAIIPVYDLAALLGYAPSSAPRWLILAAAGTTIGLAFAELDGYLRIEPGDIAAAEGVPEASRHAREVARIDGHARPILHLPSVLEALRTEERQRV